VQHGQSGEQEREEIESNGELTIPRDKTGNLREKSGQFLQNRSIESLSSPFKYLLKVIYIFILLHNFGENLLAILWFFPYGFQLAS
jgi:hypothetical protein